MFIDYLKFAKCFKIVTSCTFLKVSVVDTIFIFILQVSMLKIIDPMPDAPIIMWQGTSGIQVCTIECLHINLPHLNK